MTNSELLSAAAALVCETVTETSSADYAERAPYILATFCTECNRVDADYRKANGLAPVSTVSKAALPLEDDFPLVSVLTPAATYYLASMLVMDENETLGDKLFDLYVDAVASIAAEVAAINEAAAVVDPVPFTLEQIVNKY